MTDEERKAELARLRAEEARLRVALDRAEGALAALRWAWRQTHGVDLLPGLEPPLAEPQRDGGGEAPPRSRRGPTRH
jgi:hypothetical protein